MSVNVILVEGFGGVKGVSEAQRFAENAKTIEAPGTFAASLVIVNEALKESEKVIFQLFAKARDFDSQMKVLELKLKQANARKKH